MSLRCSTALEAAELRLSRHQVRYAALPRHAGKAGQVGFARGL